MSEDEFSVEVQLFPDVTERDKEKIALVLGVPFNYFPPNASLPIFEDRALYVKAKAKDLQSWLNNYHIKRCVEWIRKVPKLSLDDLETKALRIHLQSLGEKKKMAEKIST